MQSVNRPVFLHLLQIRLPLSGWISILHRITGALLFLLLPLPLYLLQLSLQSEAGYRQVSDWLMQWPLRLMLLLLLWWFAHHLFAGLRFLLIDLDRGVALAQAQRTARVVVAADLLTLLLLGWQL